MSERRAIVDETRAGVANERADWTAERRAIAGRDEAATAATGTTRTPAIERREIIAGLMKRERGCRV